MTQVTVRAGNLEEVIDSYKLPDLEKLDAEICSDEDKEHFLDNLEASAEVKTILAQMWDITIYVGGKLLEIGKIVLSVAINAVIALVKIFPALAALAILGVVIEFMMPAILVKIGLGWLITKLLLLIGGYIDVRKIILDKQARERAIDGVQDLGAQVGEIFAGIQSLLFPNKSEAAPA